MKESARKYMHDQIQERATDDQFSANTPIKLWKWRMTKLMMLSVILIRNGSCHPVTVVPQRINTYWGEEDNRCKCQLLPLGMISVKEV